MNVEDLTFAQLSQLAGCSAGALRQRVSRYKISKAEALSHCTGVTLETIQSVTNENDLKNIFHKSVEMERRFLQGRPRIVTKKQEVSQSVTPSVTQIESVTNDESVTLDLSQKEGVTEFETLFETFLPENETFSPKVSHSVSQNQAPLSHNFGRVSHTVTNDLSQSVTHETEQVSQNSHTLSQNFSSQSVTNDVTKELSQKVEELEDRLKQPAAQAITVLKSDILAVTTMIVLSVMVALSFTARIFMDAGVTSLPAHIMAVLLDFSMILFVFRGHSQIAWMFGVNIFAQVALTTSAAFFLTFMSAAVLAGFKGVLVAGSIVLAVKGLSDYVNKK